MSEKVTVFDLSKIQVVSLTESEDVAEPGGGGVEPVGADGVVDQVVAVVLVPEVGEHEHNGHNLGPVFLYVLTLRQNKRQQGESSRADCRNIKV